MVKRILKWPITIHRDKYITNKVRHLLGICKIVVKVNILLTQLLPLSSCLSPLSLDPARHKSESSFNNITYEEQDKRNPVTLEINYWVNNKWVRSSTYSSHCPVLFLYSSVSKATALASKATGDGHWLVRWAVSSCLDRKSLFFSTVLKETASRVRDNLLTK